MLMRSIPVLIAAASLAAAGHASAQPYGAYDQRYGGYDRSAQDEVVVTGRHAPPGAEVKARRVSFADLDLGVSDGAYALLGRIHGAAIQVCSPQPSTIRDIRDSSDYQGCIVDAVARAVNEVDTPTVTNLYRASYRWDR